MVDNSGNRLRRLLFSKAAGAFLVILGVMMAVCVVGVAVKLYEAATDKTIPRFSEHNFLHHDAVSVIMFALLAYSLYYFAKKPLDNNK